MCSAFVIVASSLPHFRGAVCGAPSHETMTTKCTRGNGTVNSAPASLLL